MNLNKLIKILEHSNSFNTGVKNYEWCDLGDMRYKIKDLGESNHLTVCSGISCVECYLCNTSPTPKELLNGLSQDSKNN